MLVIWGIKEMAIIVSYLSGPHAYVIVSAFSDEGKDREKIASHRGLQTTSKKRLGLKTGMDSNPAIVYPIQMLTIAKINFLKYTTKISIKMTLDAHHIIGSVI